jgi:GNAT superfamily N-acetyltransferase
MKSVRIRELTRDDMDNMEALLETRDELDREGAKKRRQLLEWIAFKNPFAENDPTYFVAEAEGRIVAHLGRMPTQFVIKGKLTKGYFIHDLYVHPEYRNKGIGFFLSMSLYKAIEDRSESFCCLVWTTPLNLEFQRRRGYYELWANRYVKLLNPDEALGKFLKHKLLVRLLGLIVRSLFLFADSILPGRIPSGMEVFKIDRFDSSFDHLARNVAQKIGISSLKLSHYLNWKFIDRPFGKMVVFAAKERGQLKGFVVVSPNPFKSYPEGTIVDILADPDDRRTISALLKKAVAYFKEQNVYSIECCLTNKKFSKLLKRLFFVRARGVPLMLANIKKSVEPQHLTNIHNWHLTYGESDEFMLESF